MVLGAVIAGVFKPVYTSMAGKLPLPLASLTTCVLIFIVLFVPILLFVGILSKEAYDLYLMGKGAVLSDQIKTLFQSSRALDRINGLLAQINFQVTGDQLNQAISEVGKIVGLFLYQQARAIASNILSFTVYFFFMLLVIYYLLIDGERLVVFIVDLSPLPREQDEKLIQKFKDMAGAVLIGNGVGGVLQGAFGGVVLSFLGFNSPFLWGVVMALLAFLPIVGIGAVLLPSAAYLVLKGRIAAGIFLIVFYILLSGGIEYLLKPRLVGQRVRMHTLLVFLSIIGGLKLFGILGIIYGPLVVTAFLTLTDIYHSSYQWLVDPGNGRHP